MAVGLGALGTKKGRGKDGGWGEQWGRRKRLKGCAGDLGLAGVCGREGLTWIQGPSGEECFPGWGLSFPQIG